MLFARAQSLGLLPFFMTISSRYARSDPPPYLASFFVDVLTPILAVRG